MTRLCPASVAAALREANRRAEQDLLIGVGLAATRFSAGVTLAILTLAATGQAFGVLLG